jgi:uncharacterized membrane protein
LHTCLEKSICESNNIFHVPFSILMNNRTKLTIVAAFIVTGIIVGATIDSIPSLVFAQASGNSTGSAGGVSGGNSTSTGGSGNSTSGGSVNSTGTTGGNSTSR